MRLSLSGVISVSASEWARRVEMRIEAGRIDDEEVDVAFDLDHGLTEQVELELLVFLDRVRLWSAADGNGWCAAASGRAPAPSCGGS